MRLYAFLVLALVGCDDHDQDDHDHDAEVSQIAIGCEHFMYGPDVPKTATLDETPGEEATLAAVHQRYVVALPATEGTEGARLSFLAMSAGDFYFMLSEDVPFAVFFEGAEVAATENIAPVADCAEAAAVHHYDLEPGSYLLRLGPTAVTSVQLVPHMAGQDHDHAE